MINDIVIAARKMQAEKGIEKIWVIDTDAHKGDGTAAITAGDDTIVTLSVHMASGWPLDGPQTLSNGTDNPALIPSDRGGDGDGRAKCKHIASRIVYFLHSPCSQIAIYPSPPWGATETGHGLAGAIGKNTHALIKTKQP
jgi:hypothetical protein